MHNVYMKVHVILYIYTVYIYTYIYTQHVCTVFEQYALTFDLSPHPSGAVEEVPGLSENQSQLPSCSGPDVRSGRVRGEGGRGREWGGRGGVGKEGEGEMEGGGENGEEGGGMEKERGREG